ncbi:DUF6443 domain-containing protein [Aquimarina mytili]|nr:DUF6443 domain-containing protein [Aquimarina mytili]
MNTIFKTIIYTIGLLLSISTTYGQGLVPSEDQNYVMAVQAQAPFTTANALETAPEDQKIQTITYYDGLGRAIQQNAINASTNNNDIISHIEYDGLGRQTKQYLPFEATGVPGSYREVNIHQDINAYYQNKYPDDFAGVALEDVNAYSETILEASPLNRVEEQAAPGKNWKYTRHKDPVYASFPTDISYVKNWSASEVLDPFPPAYSAVDLDNVVAININNAELKVIIWAKPALGIEALSTGKLRKIEVYPEIEYADLGQLTDINDIPIDYRASIENNYLVITPINGTPRPLTNGVRIRSTHDLSYIQYIKEYNEYVTNEHTVKSAYGLNKAAEVLRFDITITNGIPTVVPNGSYGAGELSKSIVKNENWTPADGHNKTAESFTDKNGKVVLTRSYNNGAAIDTYNVYDDYGNLTFVIPPKVDTTDGVSNTELAEVCYQYRYDERNRLVEKKDPGKGWEYIVYNELDQPILTQDEIMNAKDQWLFTKYDGLGRGIYTGMYTDTRDRPALQQEVNTLTTLWEGRDAAINIGGTTVYYSNTAFPTTNIELHSISYYDDYNFDIPAELANPGTVDGEAVTNRTKTLATGSKVRVLGTNDWTTTIPYYDKKARPIYAASKNEYLSTLDIAETQLDFAGKVIQSKTTHTKGNNAAIIIIDRFTYDHMGRVLTQTQQINDQPVEVIASNEYDNLGQLVAKNIGGGLQHVDYKHNIRGWLTAINNGDTANGDLFGYKMEYTTTQNPLYNGNIAKTSWKSTNDNQERSYTYTYDALDRLTSAISNDGKYDLTGITYDTMGNILTLDRKGHLDTNATTFGEMDKLSYTYEPTGHKLLSVSDVGNTTFGFKDGNTIGNDYEYDQNGSITADKNKGIIDIQYNHLDLPVEIVFDSIIPKKISYVYDAMGIKVKKILNDSGIITTTEYAAAQYKNGELEFMGQPEGYIEPSNTGYQYVYQFTDHLGNIRLSYSDKDGNGNITIDEIVEESNYYPFGLKHKGYNGMINGRSHQYKYNNTELEEGLGLNWYEMPLRSYDPTIARWNRVDPVVHHGLSTYNAFDNNPIYYADPSGGNSEAESPWNRDNRENTLDSGARGSFGFNSVAGGGGIHYNSYTGQYEDRMGRAVSPGEALASWGISTDTNSSGLSGVGMLQSALNSLGNDYTVRAWSGTDPKYDPRYPHTSGRQELDEVIITTKKAGPSLDDTTGNGLGFSLSFMRVNRLYYIRNVESLRDQFRIAPGIYDYTGGIEARTRIKDFVRARMTPFPTNAFLDKYFNNAPKSAKPRFWLTNRWVNVGSKAAGVLGAVTITYDAYGVYNYYTDPNGNSHVVHPGIFTGDLLATGALYYGGPVGAFAFGIYQIGKAAHNGTIRSSEYKRDWNRTCFIAGTKIIMNDGSTKNIEEIIEGDEILSVNMETMQIESDIVLIVPKKDEKYNKIYMRYDNGKENISSAHHPFYVKGKGWAVYDIEMARKDLTFEVKQIELGDVVLYHSEDGTLKETKILELTDLKEEALMYNIKYVKKNNTFFANGILVHNRFIKNNEKSSNK